MKFRLIIFIIFLVGSGKLSEAQIVTGRGTKRNGIDTLLIANPVIINGDTVKVTMLNEVEILSLRVFKRKRDQKRYDKLVRNVKKVYPYAKMTGERMLVYNEAMQNLSRKERKELVKSFENEIKEKYGPELRKLTPGQGKILLKLIDRETKRTPYELVEELRGSIQAFFWNMLAAMFDFDLKKEFDPTTDEEDLYIDEICVMIDRGQL